MPDIDTSPEAVERQCVTLGLMADGYRAGDCVATADELTRTAALLRALAGERGWRPIETAPKDGTKVLLRFLDEHAFMPHGMVTWIAYRCAAACPDLWIDVIEPTPPSPSTT